MKFADGGIAFLLQKFNFTGQYYRTHFICFCFGSHQWYSLFLFCTKGVHIGSGNYMGILGIEPRLASCIASTI